MSHRSTTRAFAGVFDPWASHASLTARSRLEESLAPEGVVQRLEDGPLAAAWSAPGRPGSPGQGRTICLLDGHVFNLHELLDEEPADTAEALARLHERHGAELLPRLRGDFALLLWDRESGSGLVARDQLGGRPLHLHRNGRCLSFASEVRNLIRLLPATPAPDRPAVCDWLATGAPPADRALFEGVVSLEPGSMVALARGGAAAPIRYWAPRYRAPDRISARDAADSARDAIFKAVRRRAHDGGSTAVLLSGGIDSATVAATSTRAVEPASRPRRAYTVTFPAHPEIDEAPLTAAVADSAGLRATSLRLESGSALGGALPYLDAWEAPPTSPNLFFLRPLLERASEDGVRVLLDGEGGDAVFWHAPALLSDRIRSGRPLAAWRLAGSFPEYGIPTSARGRLRELRSWGRAPRSGHAPAWWEALTDGILGPGSRLLHDVSRRHAALAGLEPRHPLLDIDVVELALRLPPELAFDRRYNRPVLRHAMEGLVPDLVRLRPYKSRFDPVFAEAVERDRPAIARLLLDPRAELRDYVDGERLRELVDARPLGAIALRSWCTDAWTHALAECWLRRLAGRPMFPDDALSLVSATGCDIAHL